MKKNFLEELQEQENKTITENGCPTYKSSKSDLLDFFALGGAFRGRSEQDIISLFDKAYCENPLYAMKCLFYMRNIRGTGQGERRLFRVISKYMANAHTEVMAKNLHLISEFGRWDDLIELLDTRLEKEVVALIKEQLEKDVETHHPSLLAKWTPSENTSSVSTRRTANRLRKLLGYTPKQYRKTLSELRKRIDVIERKASSNKWSEINYSHVPSKANLKYKKAFFKHDAERYLEFIQKVSKGEAKINANTLYPSDIIEKLNVFYGYSKPQQHELDTLDALWNNLPNYFGENTEDSLCVIDTSGSMNGTPINVAVGLGMYVAERNKGMFKDHFITFSSEPTLQRIVGSDIYQKATNLIKAKWNMNTNLEKVFDLILDTAIKGNYTQSDIPKKLYIISDMEFDYCIRKSNSTMFEAMTEKFRTHGFELPTVVFWNVEARQNQSPVKMNEQGVQLVSGYSPSIFTNLLSSNSLTPYDLMIDVLNDDIFSSITV